MKIAALSFLLLLPLGHHSLAGADEAVGQDVKAAADYLRRLSGAAFDIADGTALSPNCGINRRKEIREQLELYRKTSLENGSTYTLAEKKTDGAFSALLIRSENPAAPLSTRVHAVAMLRRGEVWLPAPLPGTFANTGYGYDPAVEKTVRSLERWMAAQKITRETAARRAATDKLLGEIASREKEAGLAELNAEQAVLRFIQAVRAKDATRALAFMGTVSGRLQQPLEAALEQISRGMATDDTDNDWHYLNSPSAVVQVMKIDNSRNEVAVGFWDPLAKTREKIIHFPFHWAGGKIFVRLPGLLEVALLPKRERWRHRWRHRRGDETALRKTLPSTIFKNRKAVATPNNSDLLEAVLKAQKSGDFSMLVPLLPQRGDYFGKDENRKKCLAWAGSLWQDLARLKSHPMRVLATLEQGDIALAPLQFAKPNRPGEFATVHVWMAKLDDGWHLLPEDSLTDSGGDKARATMRKLVKRLQSQQKSQQEKRTKELIDRIVTLAPPLKLEAPSRENARILLTSFRALLRAKDTASALARCAVLEGTQKTQALKNYNYAARGAADHTASDTFLGYSQAGKWAGVTLRTTSKSSGAVDYPLYIIVNTPEGERVLLDVDLRHATNKGRKLLNADAWKKLRSALPETSLADLKRLFQAHEKICLADLEVNRPAAGRK